MCSGVIPLMFSFAVIDRAIVPNTGGDVLHQRATAVVIQHVFGDDGRDTGLCGEVRKLVKPEVVVRPTKQRERQAGAISEILAHHLRQSIVKLPY